MNLFRTLGPTEAQAFRQWARDNFRPGMMISPLWHPVVQDECRRIEKEEGE